METVFIRFLPWHIFLVNQSGSTFKGANTILNGSTCHRLLTIYNSHHNFFFLQISKCNIQVQLPPTNCCSPSGTPIIKITTQKQGSTGYLSVQLPTELCSTVNICSVASKKRRDLQPCLQHIVVSCLLNLCSTSHWRLVDFDFEASNYAAAVQLSRYRVLQKVPRVRCNSTS